MPKNSKEYDIAYYHKNKELCTLKMKRHYLKNKEYLKKQSALWVKNNYEQAQQVKADWYMKNSENIRNKNYKLNYNITLEHYNLMFEQQKGCCAICKKHQSMLGKTLAVDHCHTTGKIRKLLCSVCNTHLGIFEKKKELFEIYLKETI